MSNQIYCGAVAYWLLLQR